VKGAVAWFVRNPVAANLVMVVILFTGALTLSGLKQEVFPEFSLDLISVTVDYLGAAPEEVEEAVCVRIEEAIQGLDGIKRITSTANEGNGTVLIELQLGADAARVLDDVKTRVDAIDTFPEETEKPLIREITNRQQVIMVAVSGDVGERSIKEVAERVRDEIAALPGITQVEVSNARPYEISIEVSESELRRHGLSLGRVADAVRRSSLDLPGGSVRTDGGEILLRTKGQAYHGDEFEALVVLTRPDGTQLRLGDVARVVDGFAETDQRSRFDGDTALLIQVFRTGEQSAIEVADAVKGYVAGSAARLPQGVKATIWNDQSQVLRDRVELLTRNGLTGFVMVVALLALFLRLRLAFWVSLGIPISFLGAMALMPWLDVSINLMSLFAFVIVLGIVVDDAIVVGENIHTHQDRGGDPEQAAVEGAREVQIPVVFAVLTTVAAFVPMLAVEGNTGKIMRVIPLIVIPCLLLSLVESLLILPSHLRHLARRAPGEGGAWARFQSRLAAGMERFARDGYGRWLEQALRHRYLTLALGGAALILCFGLVGGGVIRFVFLPPVEADYVSAALTMPQGSPVDVTSEAVARLERSAAQMRAELREAGGSDVVRHSYAAIGGHPFRAAQNRNSGGAGQVASAAHLGEVILELTPAEARDLSSEELSRRWRELTGAIPDAVELSFSASLFSAGEDVNVQLTGRDLAELRAAADELKQRLEGYAGVYEITDSFREGKGELKLDIRPEAELLGLSLSDLARQVRQAFYGEEAQRVQRGRDDVRVMVRYPEDERRSLGDLEQMRIRTPMGAEVPFARVARVDSGRGYASIKRVDRRRAINVTADVDTGTANPGEILTALQAEVLPGLIQKHPGVLYSFEGQSAEQRDTLGGLQRGFAVALLVIYALLAVPLRSYFQPLLIMTAIPFGIVGAVLGHVVMGLSLTVLSMFGIVALAGVVVNDSLIVVDFVNGYRSSGHTPLEAARTAGIARFRPVILTSLTTFVGLTPLLLERSMQAQFLIPMAVSLGFGVLFATIISLLLVPAGYLVGEDLAALVASRPARRRGEIASPLPDQGPGVRAQG
jgi:multidrug efflux pump subunit AcrB